MLLPPSSSESGLTATSCSPDDTFRGDVVGDVVGDVIVDVLGDVIVDVVGDVICDVICDVIGDVASLSVVWQSVLGS